MLQDIIKQKLEEIKTLSASTLEEAEKKRIEYMGKKGLMNELFAKFKEVPNEHKKEVGVLLNELKNAVQQKLEELKESVAHIEEI